MKVLNHVSNEVALEALVYTMCIPERTNRPSNLHFKFLHKKAAFSCVKEKVLRDFHSLKLTIEWNRLVMTEIL